MLALDATEIILLMFWFSIPGPWSWIYSFWSIKATSLKDFAAPDSPKEPDKKHYNPDDDDKDLCSSKLAVCVTEVIAIITANHGSDNYECQTAQKEDEVEEKHEVLHQLHAASGALHCEVVPAEGDVNEIKCVKHYDLNRRK